jgi:hypothetical protein
MPRIYLIGELGAPRACIWRLGGPPRRRAEARVTSERFAGRCVISEADALGLSVPSVATHNTAGGGWPCCTSPANRSRAESAMGWLMPASRAGYCFATCARRRALGCGSAAARTPLLPFPRSRAGCISGLIGVFARRREPLKRLHSVGANIFGLSQELSVPIFGLPCGPRLWNK